MIGYNQQQQMILDAMKEFPDTFGLRAFPGDTFRISTAYSYVNDSGALMLYTEIQKGDQWLSFAKGTVAELRMGVTK